MTKKKANKANYFKLTLCTTTQTKSAVMFAYKLKKQKEEEEKKLQATESVDITQGKKAVTKDKGYKFRVQKGLEK